MRSLMFLLVLVIFCSLQMTSSATIAIESENSNCCMEFTKVKIPVKQVKSYYWTSSNCPRRAVVFQMISGKEFCVDPETTWVSEYVAIVDQRRTSVPVDPTVWKLTDTQFQPVSKPAPPIVKEVLNDRVHLQLKKSSTGSGCLRHLQLSSFQINFRSEIMRASSLFLVFGVVLLMAWTSEAQPMDSDPIEVAALGRPLFPGMLYDCRKDFFIAGVTLWDKKSMSENLDTHPQPHTDLKFTSEDSLSSKSLHMDVSASLKASFLAGMVEVEGSAKYLHDTKSSNHQSRVTMFYRETTRFEQLTMTQLGNITYPQVIDQKTATHVVTSVLYGAQAVMVFDWTFSENDNETTIGGDLNVMVKNIKTFYINGKGSVNMTESDKKKAEHIACTFHGDVLLKNNPTTYMEALETYKLLPTLLKENNQSAVPVIVTLYPLHRLNKKAARLVREISTNLVSNIEDIMEALEKTKRTCNDLLRNTLINVFSDLKERLLSFQESLRNYKTMLQEAVSRVLPAIRGKKTTKEKSLEDILKIHYDSDFNADKLNQWLADAKSELSILSFQTMVLDNAKIEDSDGLNTILLNPNIDAVVCLTFTSLNYEDKYLSALKEFLKSDKFKDVDQNKILFSGASFRKWFTDPDVIKMMRDNLSHFRGFSEANKDEKRISFIISAISNSNINGSSIYLYEQGKLTDTQFQPVSKPAPPIVKDAPHDKVYLQLKKSPTGETVSYRVEVWKSLLDPLQDSG